MTGFALLVWILIFLCVERTLKIRIKRLEDQVSALKTERRVILADDIEKLEWAEIPLPPGSHYIDLEGVHEKPTIHVLTFKSKAKKVETTHG